MKVIIGEKLIGSLILLSLFFGSAYTVKASGAEYVKVKDQDERLNVTSAWARATPPGGKMAAVYLGLTNLTVEEIQVLGVETERAASSGIHETHVVDGVARMRQMQAFSIQPGETRLMAPGGVHVMLMGLSEPLTQGESFQLRVILDEGQIDVPVKVVPISQISAP